MHEERSLSHHVEIALSEHVDWAYTPLCVAVLNRKPEFNERMDQGVFIEAEVDVVLSMVKGKFNQFNHTEALTPYHAKARETLRALLAE